MLSANYKLKTRSTKQESASRRIRTEITQNSKKISFYLGKAPLNENKRITNQSNQSDAQQAKKPKSIKSIISKNVPLPTKLTTEPHDRQNQIQSHHKQAIQKLFGQSNYNAKKQTHSTGARKEHLENNNNNGTAVVQTNPGLTGMARYQVDQKIGSGTFGTVFKARDKRTLENVAIKKVFQDRKYKNRQLQILKTISHPNVLEMKDCFFTYESDKQFLNVVMDHYQSNLYETICRFRKKGEVPKMIGKLLAYQMFRSLLYLNHACIAHRDIKPHNILVNQTNWKLVICDFGSAKKLQKDQPNIAYICSRCYRAPELIFGNINYTTQIDMWSVGCVLAQMLLFQPIFRADSNIDQLVQIIRVLGTPTEAEIFQMNPDGQFKQHQLPKIGPKNWNKVFKKNSFGQGFLDLLSKVLTYSPYKRLTPLQALAHPFFNELRDQSIYNRLKQQYNVPNLFNFRETKQAKSSALQSLIPKWYSNKG